MTSITLRATESIDINKKEAERAKNMFALGLLSWMYSRPTEVTIRWLEKKFAGKQAILDANLAAFKAGYNFGETTELFAHHYEVKRAPAEPGIYRNVSGNTALAGPAWWKVSPKRESAARPSQGLGAAEDRSARTRGA